jgi:hypothetical protein
MDTTLHPLLPGVVVMVSGISQHQETARAAFIGDEVLLTHDISNPYDRFAVRIDDSQGNILGYVPRTGRLNERLLLNQSGAIFKGVIVEKLEQDTVGLRVRIIERMGRRGAQFGSDLPGIRALDRDTEPSAAPEPEPEPASEEPTAEVFSTTGRLLGTLVEATGGKVRARNAAGSVVSYPSSVVQVRTSGALTPETVNA